MTAEIQKLKRRIHLKRQAIPLIKREIIDLQTRLALLVLKDHFEKQIGEKFDPTLSRKLDCITYLLEN